MPNLIYTIMALMISAVTAYAFIDHIPISALISSKVRAETTNSFQRLEAGVVNYMKSNRDINGVVTIPAPGSNMIPAIVPLHAFLQKPPNGTAWRIESSLYDSLYPSIYICAEPQMALSKQVKDGVEKASSVMAGNAVLANTCGASVPVANGTHLTYWVIANHHDKID